MNATKKLLIVDGVYCIAKSLLALVMAAPVVLAGCRAVDSTAVYDSPEAVHQALCDAIQAKDWKKVAGCLTPETRDTMARDLAATAAFGLFDVPQSALQELFKRHGLDDAKIDRQGPKAFDDVDQVAFLADMWALLEQAGDGPTSAWPWSAGSTLGDLRVQDGTATGVLVTTKDGKEYRLRIEFHQIDGRWFVYSWLPDPEGIPSDSSDNGRSGSQNGDLRSADVARSGDRPQHGREDDAPRTLRFE